MIDPEKLRRVTEGELESVSFLGNRIGDDDAKALASALQSADCKVTSIDLSNNQIGDEGSKTLASALQSADCKVTSIHLSFNQIGDEGAEALASALQSANCKVTSIRLSRNRIGDEGAEALANALQSVHCKVSSIVLSWNSIGFEGAKALASALQSADCKVTSINLSRSQIGNEGAKALASALQSATCKVTSIDLSFNQIGNEGAKALASALQSADCKVTSIRLFSNQIGFEGAKALASALQSADCKVTSIRLSRSQIGNEGAKALASALQSATCKLTSIDLFSNQIGFEGAKALASALQSADCKVTSIRLSNNQIGDEGAKALASALQSATCKVTSIRLSRSQIGNEGAKALASALQSATCKVTSIDLYENRIGDEGAKALASALQSANCKVTSIDLSSNQIGDEGVMAFTIALHNGNISLIDLELDDGAHDETLERLLERNRNLSGLQSNSEKLHESNARSILRRALANGGTTCQWMRSKLMVVGQGRAGKTSTIKSLLGQPFNPGEPSTTGADLTGSYSLSLVEDVVNWTAKWLGDELRPAAMRHVRKNLDEVGDHSGGLVNEVETGAVVANPSIIGGDALQPTRSTTNLRANALQEEREEDIARLFDRELLLDDSENAISLTVWDYGGQHLFRAMQNYVLTSHGVYLVVFDMTLLVGIYSAKHALEDLHYWLNTIGLHAPEASVILVGTHKDKVPSEEAHRSIDNLLHDRFPRFLGGESKICKSGSNGLCFVPVNNPFGRDKDPAIDYLRKSILDSVNNQTHVHELIPLSWIRACDALVARRDQGARHIRIDEAADICCRCGVKSRDIIGALRFFHELGVFVYLESTAELPHLGSHVILDPQWVIDAFTTVIRDRRPHMHGPSKREQAMTVDMKGRLDQDLNRLWVHAIVSQALLFELWSDVEPNYSNSVRLFLLDLMKDLWLLCLWRDDLGSMSSKIEYLVPSLFELDKGLATCDSSPLHLVTAKEGHFELDFSDTFLPTEFFARLSALAVGHAVSSPRVRERLANGTILEHGPSRKPYVSRNLAILCFAHLEFSMQLEKDKIVICVSDMNHASLILEQLLKMGRMLCEQRGGRNRLLNFRLVGVRVSDGSSNKRLKYVIELPDDPIELSQALSTALNTGSTLPNESQFCDITPEKVPLTQSTPTTSACLSRGITDDEHTALLASFPDEEMQWRKLRKAVFELLTKAKDPKVLHFQNDLEFHNSEEVLYQIYHTEVGLELVRQALVDAGLVRLANKVFPI